MLDAVSCEKKIKAPTVGAESLCRNTCLSYFRHLELKKEPNFFTTDHLCVLE